MFGAAARPASAALATELRFARERIEGLAMVVVSDPRFVMDYAGELQSFDYLAQHLDECANLLDRIAEGRDPVEALDGVRLAEMQQRLHSHIEGA
jgi:hypothetical protein